MSGTCIVSVRKALTDAIAELDEFQNVVVTLAYQVTTERVFAFTQNATFNHTPAAMKAGRNFRAEEGRFEFVIVVQEVGGSSSEAAERAGDLGIAFEEYVADRKQGVGGAYTLTVDGDGSLTEMVTDRAALAELIYPLKYNARLE